MQTLSPLVLNDDGCAFDPSTGNSYVLNQTGLTILRGYQDGQTGGQLARGLSERYGIEFESAARDVTDFLTQLKSLRLA